MHRVALTLFGSLSLLASVATQVPGSWVVLPLSPRPFARERHAMVFDVARNESVLFGGFNGAYMNDTWVLARPVGRNGRRLRRRRRAPCTRWPTTPSGNAPSCSAARTVRR